MALFRKPKKNFRLRNIEHDEEDDAHNLPVESVGNGVNNKNGDNVKKPPALLSFADDEEEATEVFQVKKSNYSKKLSKERRLRKGRQTEDVEDQPPQNAEIPAKSTDDDLVIVVKKEEEKLAKERQQRNVILNGRAAVMAGKNDADSEEEDEVASRFKFSQRRPSEITIESGKIPDAATIHAARKQRQRARQLHHDVIPLETPPAPKPAKKGTSRLVREEDEDSDEERVNMGTGVEVNDMSARRANYHETIDAPEPEQATDPASWAMVNPIVPPPPPSFATVVAGKELVPSAVIVQSLRDRLSRLKEVHSAHRADVLRAEEEIQDNSNTTVVVESSAPELAAKFGFYQEMRGYVTDLVECLDEKMPSLVKLEESVAKLWAARANSLAGRRRLDVRDQADEQSHTKSGSYPKWSKDEEEARTRRAAEREGRRTRRRRARELRAVGSTHVEGMSSDDEETELETSTFLNSLDEVSRLGAGLLEDVEDDFGTVSGVASRMERWREYDLTAYTEAYASLCLPKLLAPLIRFHLLRWNPLLSDVAELDSMKWWSRLQVYGLSEDETVQSLAQDPDLLLLPTIIEKAVLPKITQLVSGYWNPLSCSQTQRLVNFLKKYVAEMPGMSPNSNQIKALLEAVLAKLKHAVDNDVFIPISFVGGEVKSVFFQRQFASAVKLLRNMLSFQGLLGAEHIQQVALDSLLNRYLLAALRVCQPCDAIAKANMIVSTFPRWWFQTETKIPKLAMLTNHIQTLADAIQHTEKASGGRKGMINRLVDQGVTLLELEDRPQEVPQLDVWTYGGD